MRTYGLAWSMALCWSLGKATRPKNFCRKPSMFWEMSNFWELSSMIARAVMTTSPPMEIQHPDLVPATTLPKTAAQQVAIRTALDNNRLQPFNNLRLQLQSYPVVLPSLIG